MKIFNVFEALITSVSGLLLAMTFSHDLIFKINEDKIIMPAFETFNVHFMGAYIVMQKWMFNALKCPQ